jgi:hypothetical protein
LVAREKDGGVGVAVVVIWFEGDVYAERVIKGLDADVILKKIRGLEDINCTPKNLCD